MLDSPIKNLPGSSKISSIMRMFCNVNKDQIYYVRIELLVLVVAFVFFDYGNTFVGYISTCNTYQNLGFSVSVKQPCHKKLSLKTENESMKNTETTFHINGKRIK